MKVQLKSTDGTENLYPVTAANSVIFQDGNNLEAKFPELVGKSAYQSWLDAGHTGTESDFLAALQGNSGYTGAAGELEVVNNLTDGGATAALSAEMGKEIGETLDHEDTIKIRKSFSFDSAGYSVYREGVFSAYQIPVTGGTKIIWKNGYGIANGIYLIERDDNGTRKAAQASTASNDKTITLNAGTTYVNAPFSSNYADAGIYKENGEVIWKPSNIPDGIEQRVTKLEAGAPFDLMEEVNVTYTDGYVIDFDGTAKEYTSGRISNYIPVIPGDVYESGGIQDNTTVNYLMVCGYSDANEESAIPAAFPFGSNAKSPRINVFTVPEGVNYIRLSNWNWDGGRIDSVVPGWEPFVGLRHYYRNNDAMTTEVTRLASITGIKKEISFLDFAYCNGLVTTSAGTKLFRIIPTSTNQYKVAFVPCSSGDQFTINSTITMTTGLCFYDSSLTLLSSRSLPFSGVVVAPENASWLLLNAAIADKGNYIGADRLNGLSIWRGTRAQYNAMESHDNNILYLIVE